jgi:hypothetical protein
MAFEPAPSAPVGSPLRRQLLQLATRKEHHVPGPQQIRQQERHEEKLKDIQEQVAQGKLVIRKMTAAERKRYPPREPGHKGARAKRR